jgi:membrane fusion protein (multidrug efflux system)
VRISNKGIILIVIVAVIGLALPKVKSIFSQKKSENRNPGFISELAVKAYIARPQNLENKIFVTGTILANEEIEIRSEISGKVEKIFFNEGSRVKKGDILIKVDDSELQAQLLKAQYQKKLAEEKEYRQRLLLEKEAISRQEYEIALTELNTLEAEIQLIKARIDKTEIRAPFDGVIGLRYISVGSYISPSVKITTLQNIDTLKLEFSVPEKYIRFVDVGDRVNFKVQGSDKRYSAVIYAIDPKIDPATRTLQVRAIFPNKNYELLPGSFAEIEVILEEIPSAILIPSEAIIPTAEGSKVFVYNQGKAYERNVETGIRTERFVQIKSGLNPRDTVLTTGLLQLKSGFKVRITSIE